MDNIIEDALSAVEGYLLGIFRDTENGWYELQVGIPTSWVFRGNKIIDCSNIVANDEYKIVKVSPYADGVRITIDELIEFVSTIIKTNIEIKEREDGFLKMIEQEKLALQEKAKNYYNELEELKEKSFTKFGEDEKVVEPKQEPETVKKRQYVKKNTKVENNE